MFKKLLASVGIGACKIDTQLASNEAIPGGMLQGEIVIQGGNTAQQINGFSLALMTEVKTERGDRTRHENFCLQRFRLADVINIEPGSRQQLPFELPLGTDLPVTHLEGRAVSKVWLSTEADIAHALDPSDKDFLIIDASPLILNCVSAMQELGYQLKKVDVEKGPLSIQGRRNQSGCYQEFEFQPEQWLSGIREVELSFLVDGSNTLLRVEIDRTFSGDNHRALCLSSQASEAQAQEALSSILT